VNISDVLARIPYLERHHIALEDVDGAVLVRMPLRTEVTNHVGTMHAGAMFTAAETAAGVAAWRVVPDDQAFVLLRSANVRYTRRAEGDVAWTARIEDGVAKSAREEFANSGRADVEVAVKATDPGGEKVFEGTFDYALRPRPQKRPEA